METMKKPEYETTKQPIVDQINDLQNLIKEKGEVKEDKKGGIEYSLIKNGKKVSHYIEYDRAVEITTLISRDYKIVLTKEKKRETQVAIYLLKLNKKRESEEEPISLNQENPYISTYYKNMTSYYQSSPLKDSYLESEMISINKINTEGEKLIRGLISEFITQSSFELQNSQ